MALPKPKTSMIAFFDTSIYIDYLKGVFPKSLYDRYFKEYLIRVCPVVYQELIRCVRSEGLRKKIEDLAGNIIFLPPPTIKMWIRAGELAGRIIGSYDKRSLERIQNDLLIALTARETGSTLITKDGHFKIIQKHIPFRLAFHA